MTLSHSEKVTVALRVLKDQVDFIEYSDVYEQEELEDQDEGVCEEIYNIALKAKVKFEIGGVDYE